MNDTAPASASNPSTPAMLTQSFGSHPFPVSRIALGCMGLAGTWNPAEVGPDHIRRAVTTFETALQCGITFYDHADIYGGTACESVFKECLKAVPGSRERIFIATKVGIRSGYYDHSAPYISQSIDASLSRLGIDYVDLYQLHRPDPLTHPEETANVLDELVASGKVRMIGVSNYYPHQVLALKRFLQAPIVSNQISLSLFRLDPIYEGRAGGAGSDDTAGDGVLDQCFELGIVPLAYSPLAKGLLSGKEPSENHPRHQQILETQALLKELSPAYNNATPTQLALAWLLGHPSQVIPLVGSNNPDHIKEAANTAQIPPLSRVDWYRLWVAARGERVP